MLQHIAKCATVVRVETDCGFHAKNLHASPLGFSGIFLVVVCLPTRDYSNIASDSISTMQRARETTLTLPTRLRRNLRRVGNGVPVSRDLTDVLPAQRIWFYLDSTVGRLPWHSTPPDYPPRSFGNRSRRLPSDNRQSTCSPRLCSITEVPRNRSPSTSL